MADTTAKRCKTAYWSGNTFIPAGTVVGSLESNYVPATHQQFYEDIVITSTS